MSDESQLGSEGDFNLLQPYPEGIGGWLLYFCIVSIFAGPLVSLPAVIKQLSLYWLSCYVTLIIFSIAAGFATLMRAKSALTLVRFDLLAKSLYGVAQVAWAFHLHSLNRPSLLISQETGRAVGTFLAVAIWFWYFKVSIRVRNTFGRNI